MEGVKWVEVYKEGEFFHGVHKQTDNRGQLTGGMRRRGEVIGGTRESERREKEEGEAVCFVVSE